MSPPRVEDANFTPVMARCLYLRDILKPEKDGRLSKKDEAKVRRARVAYWWVG